MQLPPAAAYGGNQVSSADMKSVMETDRELLRRADPAAFGKLFERHAKAVYNYCFRRTADWATAEDLTSIVFLEAWRKRNEVRIFGDSLLPWLYGVATNILRNRSRALKRYHAALARLPLERQSDFADDVAARIDDARQMRIVLEAFHELPQRDQDVLALCVWSALSYEEAALALDLPVGTVRSRLSRARRRLRDDTDEGGFSPQRRALAK